MLNFSFFICNWNNDIYHLQNLNDKPSFTKEHCLIFIFLFLLNANEYITY